MMKRVHYETLLLIVGIVTGALLFSFVLPWLYGLI